MRIGSTTERPVRLHMVRASNGDLFVVDAEGRVWVKTPGFRSPPPEHGWRVQAKDVDAAILAGLAPFTIVARLRGREAARELAGVADRLAGARWPRRWTSGRTRTRASEHVRAAARSAAVVRRPGFVHTGGA